MQNYFLPVASPIIGNVFSIVESCRLQKVKTIFTSHGHRDSEKDNGMLLMWWGDCIQYGTKDWDNCVRGIVKVEG